MFYMLLAFNGFAGACCKGEKRLHLLRRWQSEQYRR